MHYALPELVAQGLTCSDHLIHIVELRDGGREGGREELCLRGKEGASERAKAQGILVDSPVLSLVTLQPLLRDLGP